MFTLFNEKSTVESSHSANRLHEFQIFQTAIKTENFERKPLFVRKKKSRSRTGERLIKRFVTFKCPFVGFSRKCEFRRKLTARCTPNGDRLHLHYAFALLNSEKEFRFDAFGGRACVELL